MAWSIFSTKLVEVFDRVFGNWSRPAQIIKEAAAKGDAARLIAAGERDAERIRRGELDIEVGPELVRVPVRPAEGEQQLAYGHQIAARIAHQELRREQNLEKIAYYTTEEAGDGTVSEEGELDDEWLTQFFKNAQDVSTDQLQRLWARLLAGAIKSPGSYSIDTIDFMRRLTSARAQQIQTIGPYLFVGNAIIRTAYIDKQEWNNFEFWLELENLGIIDRMLLTEIRSEYEDRFERVVTYGDKVLLLKHQSAEKIIKLGCHRVTKLGREVLSLGKFEPDYEYLVAIAKDIKGQSFDVFIGDLIVRKAGRLYFQNLTEIA